MFDFLHDVYRGKTIGRILQNRALAPHLKELSGTVIDVAGTTSASYRRFLPSSVNIVAFNREGTDSDVAADFNEELPVESSSADAVLLINALYIAHDAAMVLSEARRVLKSEGVLLVGNPFIANEMPEPHDYERLTAEGLVRVLEEAGFKTTIIERVGERATAAAHLTHPLFLFNTIRLAVFCVALLLDACIPKRVRQKHPAPISYLAIARP